MFNTKISILDSCVPELTVTNSDLSKFLDTSDEWISSRTGIKERRISTGKNTSHLCAETGEKILEKAGLSPKDIDLIIVATVSPDYMIPSTACLVQSILKAENAVAFDISAACSGFVYALSIADKFIKSGMYKNALIFGGETLSKIVDWTDRATCVLFGDGAGGALLERSEKSSIIAEDLHSDGSLGDALVYGQNLVKNPFSKEAENEYYLTMKGKEIFSFATKVVPKSIMSLIEKAKISIDEIKYIVPHQANSRIVEVFAKKIHVGLDKFYLDIDKYGNTSAGSIPIALAEMSRKNLISEGDKIIITGFGGGLTWGSILLEI